MRPWRGLSIFFEEEVDAEARIAQICALHDVPMRPAHKSVTINEGLNETVEIVPYSEHYDVHPHFLLASANGWKTNPPRCDPFTGKSAMVMKTRRSQIRKTMRPKVAHRTRLRLIEEAQREISEMQGLEETMLKIREDTNDPMEVDAAADESSNLICANRTKPLKTNKY